MKLITPAALFLLFVSGLGGVSAPAAEGGRPLRSSIRSPSENPEVDFSGVGVANQGFPLAPRQSAVEARGDLLAECSGFGPVLNQGGGNFRTRLGFAGKLIPQAFTEIKG